MALKTCIDESKRIFNVFYLNIQSLLKENEQYKCLNKK